MNCAKYSRRYTTGGYTPGPMSQQLPVTSSKRARSGSSSRSTSSAVMPGSTGNARQFLLATMVWVLTIILVVVAAHLIRSIADQPDVYTSYLTQKCVKVVNADGTPGDCAKLPERYNNIWVE